MLIWRPRSRSMTIFLQLFYQGVYHGVHPHHAIQPARYVPVSDHPRHHVWRLCLAGGGDDRRRNEDPFGKDSNDLPLTQLPNRIRANVHKILGVDLHKDVRVLADEPYSMVF